MELVVLILRVLAIPAIAIGASIYFALRRFSVRPIASVLTAIVVAPMIEFMVFSVVQECSLSNWAQKELMNSLSAEELNMVVPDRVLCATAFSFQRRGKLAQAFAVSGLFRSKLFIADDRSP